MAACSLPSKSELAFSQCERVLLLRMCSTYSQKIKRKFVTLLIIRIRKNFSKKCGLFYIFSFFWVIFARE